jgi:hypothetical protein
MVPVRPATISTRETGVPSSPNLRNVETSSRWYAAMTRLSERRQRLLARGPISVVLISVVLISVVLISVVLMGKV